ncbi:YciI family protein [Spirosoma fluminis]
MQYVIHAYDHTDSGALDRRMEVRPRHLDFVRQLKAKGQFLFGGALLDPNGKMIGSMLLLELDTEDQLAEYLQTDPYAVEGVWETIDVKPFRKADV